MFSPGAIILGFILFHAFTTIFLFYLLAKVSTQYTELKVYLDALLQAHSDAKPAITSLQTSLHDNLQKLDDLSFKLTQLGRSVGEIPKANITRHQQIVELFATFRKDLFKEATDDQAIRNHDSFDE